MAEQLPTAEDWFTLEPADEYGVRLVKEAHSHEFGGGNMWLVEGSERCLIVETGVGFAPLREFLEAQTDKPIIAFTSVGYYDHAGGLHQFDERLIHKDDAHRLREPSRHNTVAEYYMNAGFTGRPQDGFDPATFVMPACEPTRLLADGDTIDLGDRVLEVLHLPGVTDGTCGLFERQSGALFTGEAFVWRDGYVYDGEPAERSEDANRARFCDTIRRLRDVPATAVYPGHNVRSSVDSMRAAIAAYLDANDQAWSKQ